MTTLISRFKDSKGLIGWAHKMGREGKDMYDARDRAADIGTMAHEMIEAHVLGRPPKEFTPFELGVTASKHAEMVEAAGRAYGGYMAWEAQSKVEVIATETSMVHNGLRFGGTPDAVCIANGELCLLDLKTSNRVYSDYLIQVAAYCGLWAEGQLLDAEASPPPRLGEKPTAVHLLRVGKTYGDFHHHMWPIEVLRMGWRQFVLFREAYDLAKQLDKAL